MEEAVAWDCAKQRKLLLPGWRFEHDMSRI
jgi:hypothetical protein